LLAAGGVDWRGVLKAFWEPFEANIAEVSPVAVRDVIDELDAILGPHFFPAKVLSFLDPLAGGGMLDSRNKDPVLYEQILVHHPLRKARAHASASPRIPQPIRCACANTNRQGSLSVRN